MTEKTLKRVTLGLVLAAGLLAAGKIVDVHAQSVGPGGVPGAGSLFACAAANNCAALNAANTFTASQAIANFQQLQFPGADGAAIGWDSNLYPGNFYVKEGAGYALQVIERQTDGFGEGAMIPSDGCWMWTSNAFAISSAPRSFLCENGAANIYSFGSAFDAADGWIQASAIGSGASTNTDLRGHLALASGTATYTFAKTYSVAPTCVAADTTAANPVKVGATTTTLTVTGTGSDTVNYICAD